MKTTPDDLYNNRKLFEFINEDDVRLVDKHVPLDVDEEVEVASDLARKDENTEVEE